jgi:hypothetical protein
VPTEPAPETTLEDTLKAENKWQMTTLEDTSDAEMKGPVPPAPSRVPPPAPSTVPPAPSTVSPSSSTSPASSPRVGPGTPPTQMLCDTSAFFFLALVNRIEKPESENPIEKPEPESEKEKQLMNTGTQTLWVTVLDGSMLIWHVVVVAMHVIDVDIIIMAVAMHVVIDIVLMCEIQWHLEVLAHASWYIFICIFNKHKCFES